MKKIILLFAFVSTNLVNLNGQIWDNTLVKVYEEYDDLAKTFPVSGDSIHVINFWATWCKPCVAELPYFETVLAQNKDKAFKMTLVSLDLGRQIDSKVIPFLNDQGIKAEVVVLTDNKMNDYIDKVDPSWEGSIPATLIIDANGNRFYEQEFHSVKELKEKIFNN